MLLPPDRSLKKPLQAQLFEQLQGLIHSGRLAPLTRLPATRELAEELCVSRTTVLLVYDELIAEGYLQTEPAVGTFVSAHPPRAAAWLRVVAAGSDEKRPETPPADGNGAVAPGFDFRAGGSDPRLFPYKAWRSLLSRVFQDGGGDRDGDHPAGLERLRRAVARWTTAERGIPAEPEQIVIVSGRRQAQQILARLLLDRGKIAIVDGHLPQSAAAIFAAAGARVVPLPAEEIAALETSGQRVGLIWLALPRRAAAEARLSWWKRHQRLLDWAGVVGATLVEYEGVDFGNSLVSPASRESPAEVIRVAAFSPTLGRAARLAYMVLPPGLVEPASALKASLDDGRSWLEQMALARFIEEGGYARHVRRVDRIYGTRRAALIQALRRHFETAEVDETVSADHIEWPLPPHFPTAAAVRAHAWSRGVGVDVADDRPGEPGGDGERTLILGYARMDEEQIAAGVARLAAAIAELRAGDLAESWDERGIA